MKLRNPALLKDQAYINGQWCDADNGATFEVINPATAEVVREVASVGAAETSEAIAAAADAMPDWRARSAKERSKLLRAWYDLILQHQEDLALILTTEQGKPLNEASGEIAYGANYIEWFSEEAKRVYGDVIPQPANDKRLVVIKQPVGVVASITPWNFPNAMLARKAAPALAAGCTFVAKPATATPLSALALAVLAEEAGIPPGVFNVVPGSSSRTIGGEMTSNPTVRKLTFTGSTAVGKQLMVQSAATMKKLSLELGGNAPFIVFDDADMDAAVEGAIASKYRNAGQTCVCSNRLLVQAGIYDRFAAKLAEAVASLKVGKGTEAGVQIGPLIDAQAAANVGELVAEALDLGATALTGGRVAAQGECFYEPTVLSQVTDEMRVFHEEIFGPVAPLIKFHSEEEAIAMANNTPFGLASYFYSRDIGRIWRVAEALEYGIVGINEGLISNEMAPFGGVKESGTGREGSKYGIEDYLEIKYLCMGGLDA